MSKLVEYRTALIKRANVAENIAEHLERLGAVLTYAITRVRIRANGHYFSAKLAEAAQEVGIR